MRALVEVWVRGVVCARLVRACTLWRPAGAWRVGGALARRRMYVRCVAVVRRARRGRADARRGAVRWACVGRGRHDSHMCGHGGRRVRLRLRLRLRAWRRGAVCVRLVCACTRALWSIRAALLI